MDLKANLLFHDRYFLIKPLGRGASAQVWLARDTKAGDLLVAIKIFSASYGMDTYGLQNFKHEFTSVYNITHQNLLTPTNYDLCEGTPYLVLPFCENGSISGMIGRCDEDDAIHLLHDVAGGLECLHSHGMVHQDIKPDNILVDDNCNFLVTDFGISVENSGKGQSGSGSLGGTRAYMGPERFSDNPTATAEGDMWALGATVFEMIYGDAPFGDNGGLVQAQGEKIPPLPQKFSPELRKTINSLLDPDPAKRPTAADVRRITERRMETGSWADRSRRMLLYAICGIAGALVIAGIITWDYFRTKTYYYKDYVEMYGQPQGIGSLSKGDMKHRVATYRITKQKGKVRRMELVNSSGKVIDHSDTEHIASRAADMEYFYTDNGQLDYVIVRNPAGKVLYKLDYDDNLKTATMKHNDEYGTEFFLNANANQLQKSGNDLFNDRSRISRYLLTFDDNGRLIQRRYAGLQNVPACDENSIYGESYIYDDKGRRIEVTYLGADGSPISDKNGMAIRTYAYDKDNNWTQVQYLSVDRTASHDGSNVTVVDIDYDKYGNRIREVYRDLEGNPRLHSTNYNAGVDYTIDSKGHRVKMTNLGTDLQPSFVPTGYVSVRDSFNEDGFAIMRTYLDDKNMPVNFNDNGDLYTSAVLEYTPTGMISSFTMLDMTGNPTESAAGNASWKADYDSVGNMLSLRHYNAAGEPVMVSDKFFELRRSYDEFGNILTEGFFDTKGSPAESMIGVTMSTMEYNRDGALVHVVNTGKNGKPVMSSEGIASYTITYDQLGNEETRTFFDTDGNQSNITDGGYSRVVYSYDPKTNRITDMKMYTSNGSLKSHNVYRYDAKGRTTWEACLNGSGQLPSGEMASAYEYDANNRVVKTWATDINGKMRNIPGTGYALIESDYDRQGNNIETRYYTENATPGKNPNGYFRIVREFDKMNRVVVERNFDSNGNPATGPDANPEGRAAYDRWGNLCEVISLDGHGNPKLSSAGYYRYARTFNARGNVLSEEFFGLDNKPIENKDGNSKITYDYDRHGNQTTANYSNLSGIYRRDTFGYNEKNQLTDWRINDANGNPSDSYTGFARLTINYEPNHLTLRERSAYDARGNKFVTQHWDTRTGEWVNGKASTPAPKDEPAAAPAPSKQPEQTPQQSQQPQKPATPQASGPSASSASDTGWQQNVRKAANACPIKVRDGVYIKSITHTSNSITMTVGFRDVSKYDNPYSSSELSDLRTQVSSGMRSQWNVPKSVSIKVALVDKAGRSL